MMANLLLFRMLLNKQLTVGFMKSCVNREALSIDLSGGTDSIATWVDEVHKRLSD